MKNADEYSARVMAEARRCTTTPVGSQRHARRRAPARHRGDRSGYERHEEIERQTVYLRALRDSTQVQVQTFLSGLLDHVTNEYGRAIPAAAEAALRDRSDACQAQSRSSVRSTG